ncbi:MAG: prepilin-type N-terminal cleavage/methylation domain-containing protein [Gemmatimonadales bacterium]|nr:prepilin-type N-terminal cleavage/methylation domain-containing protein [Gemmatimonadales bacterium]
MTTTTTGRARRRRAERGFSLISVMVAVMLLTVGVLAVARSQTLMLATTTNVNNRTNALEIGRAHVEWLRAQNPNNLANTDVRLSATGVASSNGAYRRTVTVVDEGSTLRRVTVQVSYPRQTQPVRFVTLIYRATT